MAGPSWLVDPNRIATKIRSASGRCDPLKVSWSSNPTKSCPNCQFTIDNSDVAHEWPGLPSGVKFDPSDQEIMWHLLAKVGVHNMKPHPFIDEFIPTVEEDDGICYAHPQNLPGVKQDGRVSHFFHRAIKAYNTGTRKRRKIHGDDLGDVRWHKTGRTKPVFLDGVQKGCKKIMVLYISPVRGGKAEKTNWVMHQYHLGTGEDEREGEYVISKVFYQQQQGKQSEKIEEDISEGIDAMITKVDPVTPKSVTPEPPKSVTPEPPCTDRRLSSLEPEQESTLPVAQLYGAHMFEEEETSEPSSDQIHNNMEIQTDQLGNEDDESAAEDKWWENESQFLLSSQQLVEGLSLCDELLQSQSPNRDEIAVVQAPNNKPRLSDYARLGPEHLKRDLVACQALVPDPANIELDRPPDFRLSQPLVHDPANIELETPPDFRLSQLLVPDPANIELDRPPDFQLSQPLLHDPANIELDTPPDFRLSQLLVPDPANIELETPPDFRLSQLEFESQDSYVAWGGSVRGGKTIN